MASNGLEPQEREHLIRIRYWGCNVLGHRHRTKKSASSCILKRKGEAGELKKLQRNLSMLSALMSGDQLVSIARIHYCSDSNITKAVNSSLSKARNFSGDNGKACPFPSRTWTRGDFVSPDLKSELTYLRDTLQEMEVVLIKLVEG